VTQPDREKGRGRKIVISSVKEVALRSNLALFQPEKVKDEAFQKAMKNLCPDLFVVVAYGQILPTSVLRIPRHGAINVHASLLPRYRGAAPIAWAILRGEEVTGVTTMIMDEGMDTGDILLQAEVAIGTEENSETLHDRLASLGAQLLSQTIKKAQAGDLRAVRQDHSKATYAPPLKKEDGQIDWKKEAREIDRQIRAFNPWPGAFTKWGDRLLKIYRGEVRERAPEGKTGAVVWVGSDFIEVAAGKDSYLIREVQLEGRKKMPIREFLSGNSIPVGTVFQ
jgi:methionyl-tRNA formyltransferase